MHVEIGFGLGDFLIKQAQEHPDWGIIGLEMAWISIRRTLRKIALAGVTNVRLVQIDARQAFQRLFADQSVTSIDSLFPCPWPKMRHLKHRLFSRDFLQSVNSRLVPGGAVRIVTDHKDYFEWMCEQAAQNGFILFSNKITPQFATKYERKWLDLGVDRFFELRLVKKEHISVPLKEDKALKTHRVAHFNHERLFPTGCRDDIVVDFKDYLFDPLRQKGMVRAVVLEGEFKQDFWVEIQKRPINQSGFPGSALSICNLSQQFPQISHPSRTASQEYWIPFSGTRRPRT
ncbi:MAG: tRNA (guanosine(46)-N7)-methyltransferase TrmB [Desulfobacteraceae bacterium 4484_190.3]|nr:MAG: tRNA (guanosine(46)-N7)-methyltransferase TrmB [Desulfobacteraceae bacterium 4484_190.3]